MSIGLQHANTTSSGTLTLAASGHAISTQIPLLQGVKDEGSIMMIVHNRKYENESKVFLSFKPAYYFWLTYNFMLI